MQFVFGNVPPLQQGGFHFPQKLRTGDIHQITASTKDELDRRVLQFRVDNGLDIGDPSRETNDYLCEKWPHYCHADPDQEADESVGPPLRQRTTNWRYNRYSQSQKDASLVDQDEAERRALICSTCPNNQSNREGCPPCVVENDRVLFMLRGGRSITGCSLGGCAVTGQDNQTAAFFTESRLKYADKYQDQLPSFCWLKHE